jgi:hypothetical protein
MRPLRVEVNVISPRKSRLVHAGRQIAVYAGMLEDCR